MPYIYALVCPKLGDVRYIGKADSPEARLKSHIGDSRSGRVKHRTASWIKSLLDIGLAPRLMVLFEVSPCESWQDAEKRTIAEYIAAGCCLTNSTAGGQGLKLLRHEERAAVCASLSAAWNKPGAKEKRVSKLREAFARDECKARRAAALDDPAVKLRHAEGIRRGLFGNQEVMDRRRASQKIAANAPEVKAKKAAASRARWADPEYRIRLQQKQRAAWIKRKEGRPNALPDTTP